MKGLALSLLFALPCCLASWQQSVVDWLEELRVVLWQTQDDRSDLPTFSSEERALEYLDALLPELRPQMSLRLRRGVNQTLPRHVADLFMYRGYSNNLSCTIRQDELTITPVYTDWVLMCAVFHGRLSKSMLDKNMRQAYKRALSIVAEERAALGGAGGKHVQQYALALALHDRVCSMGTYSLGCRHPATTAASRMLLTGRGVCEGYSRVYALLLTLAGIENQYIFGRARGEAHSWNLVRLHGRWCHVDVTMDDASGRTRPFFAISDREATRDRRWERRWWPEAPGLPAPAAR